ncbi:MAG: lysine--tRNA ligase [Candidatus Kerfeldbacteria bacterium]|nr:lysine--tRNA ligase [Candidatus Kerfeldbacteria bacterium]
MAERNDQEEIRLKRRAELIEHGHNPYPARTKTTTTIQHLREHWKVDQSATISGRVRAIRLQGGSAFIDLDDGTGKLQLFLQKKQLGDTFASLTSALDLGDFLEASGVTFLTKAGEQSLNTSDAKWLAKALRPLPSNWHGLEDVEVRYRHRELDLVTNPETKTIFLQRATIVRTLREELHRHGFVEVETPMLQPLAGGASAKPFVTHHNALDIDLFLRVAPELYLKRLIVGGFNRVFEVARCFRNEGIDRDHNPEFTQVELYAAYHDYRWLMDFTEKLVVNIATSVHGRPIFIHEQQEQPLATPFPRITYHDAIKQYTEIDIDAVDDQALVAAARQRGTDIPDGLGRGKVIDELFKTHVRPKLITPTFVFDYPLELSPLAKKKADQPTYTERFQLLMGGTELGNAFSELNDPIDQRQRFQEQERLRDSGDEEAQRVDEDFLEALEYGMPPTAGLGIGIDRLTAVLTGHHTLKDVILFPTLRPKS